MKNSLAAAAILFCSAVCSFAQGSNSAVTQVLVGVDAQSGRVPQADITLKVNGKPQPLSGWSQVPPDQLQIAVLIDNNNLQKAVGDQLDSLRSFATSLPAGVQLYIGYMTDDGIQTEQQFTANHALAASRFRRPSGTSRASVSPFACLSTFVRNWPLAPSRPSARVVLLLTTGIDHSSDSAVADAQRTGVEVFAIYLNDHMSPSQWASHGALRSYSPVEDLNKVTVETGGHAYYEPVGNQPPLSDYLDRFRSALTKTYVASFVAPSAGSKLLQLKVETKLPGVKLAAPKAVMPGNTEISSVQ